jgi:hypothetical protein
MLASFKLEHFDMYRYLSWTHEILIFLDSKNKFCHDF